jgi:hypothetical protein
MHYREFQIISFESSTDLGRRRTSAVVAAFPLAVLLPWPLSVGSSFRRFTYESPRTGRRKRSVRIGWTSFLPCWLVGSNELAAISLPRRRPRFARSGRLLHDPRCNQGFLRRRRLSSTMTNGTAASSLASPNFAVPTIYKRSAKRLGSNQNGNVVRQRHRRARDERDLQSPIGDGSLHGVTGADAANPGREVSEIGR